MVNGFFQATIDFNGFSMVLRTLDHHHWMFFGGLTIAINGFSMFFILLPSLSMVFNGSGPLVKGCDGFDGSSWSSAYGMLNGDLIMACFWFFADRRLNRISPSLSFFNVRTFLVQPSPNLWPKIHRGSVFYVNTNGSYVHIGGQSSADNLKATVRYFNSFHQTHACLIWTWLVIPPPCLCPYAGVLLLCVLVIPAFPDKEEWLCCSVEKHCDKKKQPVQ